MPKPNDLIIDSFAGGVWRPGVPMIPEERRREVRSLRDGGATYAQIAAATGISKSHVFRIVKGDSQ